MRRTVVVDSGVVPKYVGLTSKSLPYIINPNTFKFFLVTRKNSIMKMINGGRFKIILCSSFTKQQQHHNYNYCSRKWILPPPELLLLPSFGDLFRRTTNQTIKSKSHKINCNALSVSGWTVWNCKCPILGETNKVKYSKTSNSKGPTKNVKIATKDVRKFDTAVNTENGEILADS